MKQKLIAYSLLLIGLVTFVFFFNYQGQILKHTAFFWILGLILFVSGFLVLKNAHISSKANSERKKIIEELLENGNRIKIDLTKCEIKSNSFIDKEIDMESDEVSFIRLFADPGILKEISSINQIMSDPNHKVDNQLKNYSIIFSTADYFGQERTFISPLIQKDKVTLTFLLDRKKETTVYIDKEDKQKYYFDLSFLYE